MGLGVQHYLSDPAQQLVETRGAGEIGAQRQRIDEEADEVLQLGARAASDGCADH